MATKSNRWASLVVILLALGGCKPAAPAESKTVSAATLPWTVDEANRNLRGKSKEDVIALFGKPSEVWSEFYYYHEPKYLKPDIGDKNTSPGGMAVHFSGGTVDTVEFRRK